MNLSHTGIHTVHLYLHADVVPFGYKYHIVTTNQAMTMSTLKLDTCTVGRPMWHVTKSGPTTFFTKARVHCDKII